MHVLPSTLATRPQHQPEACARRAHRHTLRTCVHAAPGRAAGNERSLYANREAVGAELLQLLDCSESDLMLRVAPVAELVKSVQASITSSPDWQQLRMVMKLASAQYTQQPSTTVADTRPANPWGLMMPTAGTSQIPGVPVAGSQQRSIAVGSTMSSTASQPNAAGSSMPDGAGTGAARSEAGQASSSSSSSTTAEAWAWEAVQQLTVLGLGSLGVYRGVHQTKAAGATRASARVHQLALALSLPTLLPGLMRPPAFADPEYGHFDEQLIRTLGGNLVRLSPDATAGSAVPQHLLPPIPPSAQTVQASISTAGSTDSSSTGALMLYAPCCPRALYAQVLSLNRQTGSLPRVAILGNSFASLGDSRALFKALASEEDVAIPQLLSDFCTARAFLELPAPDFAAHGVAMGLHMFPPRLLARLQ